MQSVVVTDELIALGTDFEAEICLGAKERRLCDIEVIWETVCEVRIETHRLCTAVGGSSFSTGNREYFSRPRALNIAKQYPTESQHCLS